mgnify:CR=1 FL=1
MADKLTIKQKKIVAKAIVYQLINAFDGCAFENMNMTTDEEQAIVDEVKNLSTRFKNDFTHIGSLEMIIEAVKSSK